MLKKIQLLSLAAVACVSTVSIAQTPPPPSSKNIAVLEPTLTVESKRTFGTPSKTTLKLNNSSDPTQTQPDFAEIDINGNTAKANLGIKSENGALSNANHTATVLYDLKIALDDQEKTISSTEDLKTTPASVEVSDSTKKLKVTTTVRPNQNPKVGTYSDTVTLTLTDA